MSLLGLKECKDSVEARKSDSVDCFPILSKSGKSDPGELGGLDPDDIM